MLVQQLQSLTASIAALVVPSTGTGTPTAAPQNVQSAYAALQTASSQLSTDLAAATYVSATIQTDLTNLQLALTALHTAVLNPSTP
jgi:hypothetical protein